MKLYEYTILMLIIISVLLISTLAISSVDVGSSVVDTNDCHKHIGDFGINQDNLFLFSWSLTGNEESGGFSAGCPPLLSIMD